MKIRKKEKEEGKRKFEPFTIKITVESRLEAMDLWTRFNMPVALAYGDPHTTISRDSYIHPDLKPVTSNIMMRLSDPGSGSHKIFNILKEEIDNTYEA